MPIQVKREILSDEEMDIDRCDSSHSQLMQPWNTDQMLPDSTNSNEMRREKNVSKIALVIRPQERQLMRPWLWERLEARDVPGMVWVNKEKGQFRIPWKHGSRQGWEQDRDAVLFRKWAIHTGKYREEELQGVTDPKTWKATFRCALNSLPDVQEVKDLSEKRGPNAYRVYQFNEPRKNKRAKKSESVTIENIKKECIETTPVKTTTNLKRSYSCDSTDTDTCDDDGMSDTTITDSEDDGPTPVKKVKICDTTTTITTPVTNTNDNPNNPDNAGKPEKEQELKPISNKERNKQILQMYLKNKEVRRVLANTLAEQRRIAMLQQKLVATQHWVQTTQQTTTFTSIPRRNSYEETECPSPTNTSSSCSSYQSIDTTSKSSSSMVHQLAQKCLEENYKSSSRRSPMETLKRNLTVCTDLPRCISLTEKTSVNEHRYHINEPNSPHHPAVVGSPPYTPNYSWQSSASSTASTSPATSPAARVHISSNHYSPAAGGSMRNTLVHHQAASISGPSSPNYHSVVGARQNQVIIPSSSLSGSAQTDSDSHSSPESELSDEGVISMVDDMLTRTTTFKTTIDIRSSASTARPADNASFCQLFSSSQLVLANTNGFTTA